MAAVTSRGSVRAVDDFCDAMVLPKGVLELHEFAWVMAARVMPEGSGGSGGSSNGTSRGELHEQHHGAREHWDNHREDFGNGFRESS